METFEWIIALMFGAALLSMLARRIGLPYPSLLAVGGAAVAILPYSPGWALDPHLALTLFVAPVLLDAAYDFSLRDLRRNWPSVAGLAVMAVGVTTAAVAVVAKWLVPDMPWSVAIALGAIVAPPDAAAATAVMQQIRLPFRIRTILEGESLINDATALLVYRLAVGAVMAENITPIAIVPMALVVILGSLAAGLVLAFLFSRIVPRVDDPPIALIVQFTSCFGVWIVADAVGLSGVLTIVTFAIAVARGPQRLSISPRMRIPVNAVWAAAVFVLNALAFVLVGMQLRPIFERLQGPQLTQSLLVAGAVLLTAIVARFAWVMSYNLFFRAILSEPPADSSGPGRPTIKGGLVISWAGMRGIVTLAAAYALPVTLADGSPFPYRDLVLLSAFFVVIGTLVVQGLTLRPLIGLLRIESPDPVINEVRHARAESLRAAVASLDGDASIEAKLLRKEFESAIDTSSNTQVSAELEELPGNEIRRTALAAARKRANQLWLAGTIGDAAYRALENEFDWGELSAGGMTAPASS